jgi:hypothetical protein
METSSNNQQQPRVITDPRELLPADIDEQLAKATREELADDLKALLAENIVLKMHLAKFAAEQMAMYAAMQAEAQEHNDPAYNDPADAEAMVQASDEQPNIFGYSTTTTRQ